MPDHEVTTPSLFPECTNCHLVNDLLTKLLLAQTNPRTPFSLISLRMLCYPIGDNGMAMIWLANTRREYTQRTLEVLMGPHPEDLKIISCPGLPATNHP